MMDEHEHDGNMMHPNIDFVTTITDLRRLLSWHIHIHKDGGKESRLVVKSSLNEKQSKRANICLDRRPNF